MLLVVAEADAVVRVVGGGGRDGGVSDDGEVVLAVTRTIRPVKV